jgi:peptide/nickel transport system substrate-binding protein
MDDDHDWTTRRRVLQGVGAAGVAGLAGCTSQSGDAGGGPTDAGGTGTGSESGDGTSTGGSSDATFNFAQTKSPLQFDPLKANDVPSLQVVEQLFDRLYTYSEGTTLEPQLAAGEPEVSENGTRFVVELDESATFHNGDSVTAEDVKYSFLAPGREETENGSEFDMVESVEAVDERTVQFDLKYPFGPFRHTLAWYVVPKSVREEDKEAFNTSKPVGNGPFQFVDWQEGEFVELERWDDYWGGETPNVQTARFSPVEEATTRVTTLRNGENDVVQTVPPKLYSTVEGIQSASVAEKPGLGYYYLSMNCNEGPTTDPKVREAIDYCFSMDQAVENYIEPAGERQYSPMPSSLVENWGFPADEWASIPHDKNIEKAKQLFEEAGVEKSYQWKILVPPDDKREQIGISVGNGLKEAGFSNVSVQRLDWGAFLDRYATGSEDDYNMYTLGWVDEVDPDGYLWYMFHESLEGETNGCYYSNDEVMSKLKQARESPDREKRTTLYTEATTQILEDRAHLPAYNLKNSFGVSEQVQGFEPHTISSLNPRLFGAGDNVSLDD